MADISITIDESPIAVTVEDTDITVVVSGAPGPAGPEGPAGPQGLPGGSSYSHIENSPASDWVINHNLNRYPHVTVIVSGTEVDADVTYNSLNQVTVSFGSPQSGRAELS
jgi:hypothetical protein